MKKIKETLNSRKYIFTLFFVFITVYSLFIYKDFGISYDEEIQYTHLKVSAKKIYSTLGVLDKAPQSVRESENIEEYKNKYYGVSAQFPLLILEYFPETHGPQTPDFWFIRHLYVRAAFVIAGFCFYLLIRDYVKSNFLLLTSLVLYFFHPRVSVHSFYNIKDSLFLSFFTISTYFLFKYIKDRKILSLIIFSLFTAITINIRMMGILLPAYFGFWLLLKVRNNFKGTFLVLLTFSVSISLFLYLIWPALWGNPVTVFREAFETFSNYTAWDEYIVFDGERIKGQEPPVEYIPVWIGISSPLGHILVFILGVFLTPFILLKSFKNKDFGKKFHLLLFSFCTVFLSYGAIIFFNSTLYGDWRHLYYIYPSLILMGVLGLDFLFKKNLKIFYVSMVFIIISLLSTFIWMKKNHPHYYVYFSGFAGEDWDSKWDRDMWRLSSKQLLEKFIEKNDPPNSEGKYVFFGHYGAELNRNLFRSDIRDSFEFAQEWEDSQYIVGDYRSTIGDYPENKFEGFKEYISIEVEGKKIMSLFKKNPDYRSN